VLDRDKHLAGMMNFGLAWLLLHARSDGWRRAWQPVRDGPPGHLVGGAAHTFFLDVDV
jgi:hypothetical protein